MPYVSIRKEITIFTVKDSLDEKYGTMWLRYRLRKARMNPFLIGSQANGWESHSVCPIYFLFLFNIVDISRGLRVLNIYIYISFLLLSLFAANAQNPPRKASDRIFLDCLITLLTLYCVFQWLPHCSPDCCFSKYHICVFSKIVYFIQCPLMFIISLLWW